MIKEDYCSYEVAKLLKEKGFDAPCMGRYSVRSKEFHLDCTKMCNNGGLFECAAPSHAMAMKWLREVYDIFIQISAVLQVQPFGLHYKPSIQDYHAYARHDNFSEYVTYEEAVEAACIYALKNLI